MPGWSTEATRSTWWRPVARWSMGWSRRSAAPGLVSGANTPLDLAGRFTRFEADWSQRFAFDVRLPAPAVRWVPDFPWPSHLTALGLIDDWGWQARLNPEQAGDKHVAA